MSKGCVIFDFDSTITKHHLFKNLYGVPGEILMQETKFEDVASLNLMNRTVVYANLDDKSKLKTIIEAKDFINSIFGGQKRIEQLLIFFKTLKEYGINLYIASKGITREIVTALQAAHIDPHLFRAIHGNDFKLQGGTEAWLSSIDGYKPTLFNYKPWIMTELLSTGSCGDGPIVYIDDDGEYYPDAQKMGIITIGSGEDFTGTFYKESGGMTAEQMRAIVEIFLLADEECKHCGTEKPWNDAACHTCLNLKPFTTRQRLFPSEEEKWTYTPPGPLLLKKKHT